MSTLVLIIMAVIIFLAGLGLTLWVMEVFESIIVYFLAVIFTVGLTMVPITVILARETAAYDKQCTDRGGHSVNINDGAACLTPDGRIIEL